MCGKIEKPTDGPKARYIAWVTKYLLPRYPTPPGADFDPFVARKITAEDFYALRCAYLHEASDELSNQQIRQTLNAFRFTAPRPGRREHMNYVVEPGVGHKAAQLQVDIFCNDVGEGVAERSHDIAGNHAAQGRFATLLKIY